MQLSIIVVNYNVKHFLEQCLYSVQAAVQHLEAEVFVVDNNSSDGSMAYLQPAFPRVRWIINTHNTGFGVANNQAVEKASGRYILFLNPDTLLPEDSLVQCLRFMEQHPKAGALGIQMLDGSGRFLRESKRAFPSPMTSLYKLTGFSALFPRSETFARYYLGHLPDDENHPVDVLAGAFMLVRQAALQQTGAFDQRFFMYGEDIDLSYRIQQAGWQNWYFAENRIVHFKGESTKKGSLNYVRMFYQAMDLFVQKHYSGSEAGLFRQIIQLAIWLRAGVSAAVTFVKWIGLPLMDASLVMACLYIVKYYWQQYINPGVALHQDIVTMALPVFTVIFIVSGGLAGLYEKWYKPRHAWYAMMLALVINLALYSLLSDTYRFSRGIVLVGGLLASLVILLFRYILVRADALSISDEKQEKEHTAVVASPAAFAQVQQLLLAAGRADRILGRIAPGKDDQPALGALGQLGVLLKAIPIRELIFCMDAELDTGTVLKTMQQHRHLRYAFHYHNSGSIISSSSKQASGEWLAPQTDYSIQQPAQRRYKQLVDLGFSLLVLLSFPLHLVLVRRPFRFFRHCLEVLTGRRTWVGYCTGAPDLPPLPRGVLFPNGLPAEGPMPVSAETAQTIDHWYARWYNWKLDVRLLIRNYRYLGG